MKKVLKVLLWVVGILAAIILVGALFLPSETKFEQTVVINAKPSMVYKQVSCLKNWAPWSPFKEGVTENTFSGAECGQGAIQSWVEDGMSGKQTITEALENEYLKTELDFQQGELAYSEWKFEADGEGTKVTWTFESKAAYPLGRWIGFTIVKPMLTESYIKGLNALKNYAETLKPDPDLSEIYKTETVTSVQILSVRTTAKTAEIESKMGAIYGDIMKYIKKNKLTVSGVPVAIYHTWTDTETDMECGIPFTGTAKGDKKIKVSKTYDGKVVTFMHLGSYESSGKSWGELLNYVKTAGFELNGAAYEEYITDPTTEPDTSKWMTKLCQPIK